MPDYCSGFPHSLKLRSVQSVEGLKLSGRNHVNEHEVHQKQLFFIRENLKFWPKLFFMITTFTSSERNAQKCYEYFKTN